MFDPTKKMYAWIMEDGDGNVGTVATKSADGVGMSAMSPNSEALEEISEAMELLAYRTKTKISLVEFSYVDPLRMIDWREK